jgi:hypothetical protein
MAAGRRALALTCPERLPSMLRARFPAVLFVAMAVLPLKVTAKDAEDSIVTDRPDFVESSVTVGKGRFQVETSVAGEHNRDGPLHEDTLSTPTLLRLGVAPNWELRLETDAFTRVRTEDTSVPSSETVRGFADISVGTKWHAVDPDGWKPSMAWLAHADLPTGSRDLRGHAVRPSLRASFEWELPADFSLGVMPGIVYDSRDDGHRFVAGLLGVTFGHSWTERLRSFVEVAARQLAAPDDGGNQVTYDFGFAYLITPRIQIDAAAFLGANHHTPDVAWTVGLSMKF